MITNLDELERVMSLFDGYDDNDEVLIRAYINRSYYIIYHKALDYIESNTNFDMSDHGDFGNTGSHNRIFLALKELGEKDKYFKKLSYKFQDFLLKRHKADYKLKENISEYDLKQVQNHYNEIPKMLK